MLYSIYNPFVILIGGFSWWSFEAVIAIEIFVG
jgi:hypothetical protein